MPLLGIREVEHAGLKAWPGLETASDGAWVMRAAGGYTKRANSVQCLDPDDADHADARLAAARRWFEARGLPPVFRVTPLAGSRIIAALDAAGWSPVEESRTLGMALDGRRFEVTPHAEILPIADPALLAAQGELQGYDDATVERLRAIVKAIAVPARGVIIRDPDGTPVASALIDVADGIAMAGNVVTAASARRRGYGLAVMNAGLAWAAAEGARFAALNMLAANAAALALYRRLGYVPLYDYHYRKPLPH